MGMFDYIRVKMRLPDQPPPPKIEKFQTRDTPNQFLNNYTIEADGTLIEHVVRYEDHSNPDAASPLERFAGMMTSTPEPEKDHAIAFHGDITFYHYDDQTREWWEYVARFTEGKCVRIWCSEHTKGE